MSGLPPPDSNVGIIIWQEQQMQKHALRDREFDVRPWDMESSSAARRAIRFHDQFTRYMNTDRSIYTAADIQRQRIRALTGQFADMDALLYGVKCESDCELIRVIVELAVWYNCCSTASTATASTAAPLFPSYGSDAFKELIDQTFSMFECAKDAWNALEDAPSRGTMHTWLESLRYSMDDQLTVPRTLTWSKKHCHRNEIVHVQIRPSWVDSCVSPIRAVGTPDFDALGSIGNDASIPDITDFLTDFPVSCNQLAIIEEVGAPAAPDLTVDGSEPESDPTEAEDMCARCKGALPEEYFACSHALHSRCCIRVMSGTAVLDRLICFVCYWDYELVADVFNDSFVETARLCPLRSITAAQVERTRYKDETVAWEILYGRNVSAHTPPPILTHTHTHILLLDGLSCTERTSAIGDGRIPF